MLSKDCVSCLSLSLILAISARLIDAFNNYARIVSFLQFWFSGCFIWAWAYEKTARIMPTPFPFSELKSVDFKLRFPGLEEAVDLIGGGGAGVIIRLGRLRAAFLRRRENPRAEFFFQLRVALRRDVGKIN